MVNDLVSIITPVFNAEDFIGEVIKSVLAQSYEHWEMIVVEDCSTDRSREIISAFAGKDERIRLVELQENKGVGEARDTGLKKAGGKYIAFIDSDDWWYPEKLEKQLKFMKEGNYPISYTAYEMIDTEGKDIGRVIHAIPEVTFHTYLKSTIIGLSTAMVNREIVGDFSISNMRMRVDTQLWIRLLRRGFKAYGMDEVLTKYRIHSNSISRNRLKAARQTWKLYFKVEKLGFFRSIYYFSHYALSALKKHYF